MNFIIEDTDPRLPADLGGPEAERFSMAFNSALASGQGEPEALSLAKKSMQTPEDRLIAAGEEPGIVMRGGPGSGFQGHAGRPGEVGGSLPAGGTAVPISESQAEVPQEYEAIEKFGGQWDHSKSVDWDHINGVKQAENEIRGLDRETLIAIDATGAERFRKIGDETSVPIDDIDTEKITDAEYEHIDEIMIHNHPGTADDRSFGGSFSMDDIDTAVTHFAEEIRAIAPEADYLFRFAPGFRDDKWYGGGLTLDPVTGATVTTGEIPPFLFATEKLQRNLSDWQTVAVREGMDVFGKRKYRAMAHAETWAALADEYPNLFEYEARYRK
jgi:hypothetical protein